MHLFHTPDIAESEFYRLGPEESRHAAGVLRLRAGDRVQLTDGRGLWCQAEVLAGATSKECCVRIVSRTENYGRRPYKLHVAIAPTKHIDRYEWFLEKATEIGVDRITPLLCEHSERKIVKRDRGEKIILSAVKQSLKAYVPVLDELTPFRDFITAASAVPGALGALGASGAAPIYRERFVAFCDEGTPLDERVGLFSALSEAAASADRREYCVLIGPEGDFSPGEIAAAREGAGFSAVTLGESRLRTETAGVMAAAMAAMASPDRNG